MRTSLKLMLSSVSSAIVISYSLYIISHSLTVATIDSIHCVFLCFLFFLLLCFVFVLLFFVFLLFFIRCKRSAIRKFNSKQKVCILFSHP